MPATNVLTGAGTRVYIGSVNPNADESALIAESTWKEIGEVTNIPQYGKTYTKVEHKPIASRGVVKIKGSFDNGSLALDLARVPGDEGQAACRLALNDDRPFNFKIEFNDNPGDGSPDAPTTQLFAGKVFSYTTNIGQVDSVIAAQLTIEIDGEILEIEAE